MGLYLISVLLILLFWPLNLLLSVSFGEFIYYSLPLVTVLLSYALYKNKNKYFIYPLIIIPVLTPKLALFSLLFTILTLILDAGKNSSKTNFVLPIIILAITSFFSWKDFYGQTILTPDYEARQGVIRNTQLYNSVFLARLFHNKARIIIEKFNDNFFALTDPNNYFFGFHPREIIGNNNLQKFPILSIFPFLIGAFYYKKIKDYKFLLIFVVSALLSLSLLKIFDLHDFLLYLPVSLLIIRGVNELRTKKYSVYVLSVFTAISIVEYLRLFLEKIK